MEDKRKDNLDALIANTEELEDEGAEVIEATDADGNVSYFMVEFVYAVGKQQYAVLCPLDDEGELIDGDEDEDCGIIAKIVFDENGEPCYVAPEEDEFEAALEEYNKIIEEEEAAEEE